MAEYTVERVIFNDDSEDIFNEVKINDVEPDSYAHIKGRLSVSEKVTKGKPYFLLTIKDNTGFVSSAIWNSSKVFPLIDMSLDKKKVIAKGKFKKNGSFTNIDLTMLSVIEEDDLGFLSTRELKEELENRINSISSEFLKRTVENVFKLYEESILEAPFSEKTAYTYKGGLAHFTIDMCDMVSKISECVNCGFWSSSTILNDDMLLAGAILANLGKSKALSFSKDVVIEKTPLGIMEEDSTLSRDMAKEGLAITYKEFLDNKKPITEEVYNKISMELLHMISSAKNNPSWGALTSPRSKNAMILSNINNIVYTKGLFESLERENNPNTFVKAYDNGKIYYLDDILE